VRALAPAAAELLCGPRIAALTRHSAFDFTLELQSFLRCFPNAEHSSKYREDIASLGGVEMSIQKSGGDSRSHRVRLP
jgi:hypothetical protein